MATGHELSPTYSTGSDFAVEAVGVRFCFSARDFSERVGQAAVALRLIEREDLGPSEVDRVALAVARLAAQDLQLGLEPADGLQDLPRAVGAHAGELP